jgi:hypothetical protein
MTDASDRIARRDAAAAEIAAIVLDAYEEMVCPIKELVAMPRYELDERDLAGIHEFVGRAMQAEIRRRLRATP